MSVHFMEQPIIRIDGSYGEGGGQILRIAIALASLLGAPVNVVNIRAHRPNPGLAAQHLTAIRAVSTLCNAKVQNLAIGSREITYYPKGIRGGKFEFDVGTAGSVTLVLQACMLPSLFAERELTFKITGGTDVRWAPPVDYFKHVFLKLISKLGIDAELKLVRRGYYPKGGGEILFTLRHQPARKFQPLILRDRGKLINIEGIAYSNNLPSHIVSRIKASTLAVLEQHGYELGNVHIAEAIDEGGKSVRGTGTGIVLWANTTHSVIGSSALGEPGLRAERVGQSAALELIRELRSNASVDRYACDQLLPYLTLATGVLTTAELTQHSKTCIWLIEQFLGKRFDIRHINGLNRISCTNPYVRTSATIAKSLYA